MRALILFAGASLALTACGKNDNAGNSQTADDGLTAEKIVANDVTAIDAVTGDAANMAADMNYETLDANLDETTGSNDVAPVKRRSTAKPPARTTEAPAATSAAETTTNSAD